MLLCHLYMIEGHLMELIFEVVCHLQKVDGCYDV